MYAIAFITVKQISYRNHPRDMEGMYNDAYLQTRMIQVIQVYIEESRKVFTSIPNSRLKKYADSVDMIPNAQAGFRKGYSTNNVYMYLSFGENYIALLLSLKSRLIRFGGWSYGKNW